MNIGTFPIAPNDFLKMFEKQLQDGGTPTGSNLPGGGFGDLAFLTMWPDELNLKNPRGRQFVAIRPNRFPIWQSIITGAGTTLNGFGGDLTTPGFNTVITTACYCQINSDPEMRSSNALTEDVLGIIAFLTRVISAMQFWFPVDPNANATFLREACRMTDGGFGLQSKKVGDAWWVSAIIDWEAKFTAAFPS